jgi:hypothetical protein
MSRGKSFAVSARNPRARANALENNVSLYYTEGGSRRTLKYVDAPVTAFDDFAFGSAANLPRSKIAF